MLEQMTFMDLLNATSSPESAGGPSPCSSQDGRKTGQSGREAVHASRSATQDSNAGPQTSAICGQRSQNSSESASLQSRLANRLQQRLGVHGSPEYSLIWKAWAITGQAPICALRGSPRRICVSGFTGWPTATVQDAANNAGPSQWNRNSNPLNVEVHLSGWPTTRANDAEKRGDVADDLRNGLVSGASLSGWPTPSANNHTGPGTSGRQGGENLQTAAHGIRVLLLSAETESTAAYRLNPYFSAWLMGFPAAWLKVIDQPDFLSPKKKAGSRGGRSD